MDYFSSAKKITVTMWTFARLFLCHGIVYALVAGAALLGELAHPKERAILTTFYGGFYSGGGLIAAGIVLNTLQIQNNWSWRLPSILQCAPSVFQIGLIYLVPESPRVSVFLSPRLFLWKQIPLQLMIQRFGLDQLA